MWQTTSWPNGAECPETDPGTDRNLVPAEVASQITEGLFLKTEADHIYNVSQFLLYSKVIQVYMCTRPFLCSFPFALIEYSYCDKHIYTHTHSRTLFFTHCVLVCIC